MLYRYGYYTLLKSARGKFSPKNIDMHTFLTVHFFKRSVSFVENTQHVGSDETHHVGSDCTGNNGNFTME